MPKFNDIDLENWKESDIWTDSLWLINEKDKKWQTQQFLSWKLCSTNTSATDFKIFKRKRFSV